MKNQKKFNLFKVYNLTPNLKNVFKLVLFFTVLSLLLVFSKTNFNSVKESTSLFISSIIPSLFPFILFTEIILSSDIIESISKVFGGVLNKIFRISKNSTPAVIIGFLCGYPMGAKTVMSLYESGKISRNDASKLLCFTNNCNPVFILSTIGISIFNNLRIGVILLLSHYISSILIAFFVTHTSIIHESKHLGKPFLKKDETNALNSYSKKTFFEILKSSILKSFITLGTIFGFIILFNLGFSILNELMAKLNIDKNVIAFLSGIFEVTKGCNNIYRLNIPLLNKIIIISFLLGFSGFCILFQVYSVIQNNAFKFKLLFISKFLQGTISTITTYLLLKISNVQITDANLEVFSNISKEISYNDFLKSIQISYVNSTFLVVAFLCILNIIIILKDIIIKNKS